MEIIITEDLSPTLQIQGCEPMHALTGALSETLYNYRPTIEFALTQPEPKILSVGLGLGYNEILCYALASSSKNFVPQVHSYESESWLKEDFLSWISSSVPPDKFAHDTYQTILLQTTRALNKDPIKVKELLQEAVTTKKLQLHQALTPGSLAPQQFNGILYDAFSQYTNPELWTEEFLSSFIDGFAGQTCQISTYASTGHLKRALKSKSFQITTRKGWGKKRESLIASRVAAPL